MFSQKAQRKYIRQYRKPVLENLILFSTSMDMEELHQWRLVIKKLRSLHALSNPQERSARANRKVRDIDHLFQITGIIRQDWLYHEMQQHLGFSTNGVYNFTPESILLIKKLETKSRKWKHSLKEYFRLLEKETKDYSDKEVLKHLAKSVAEIQKQLKKKPLPRKLHSIRKQLKNLVYLLEALPKNLRKKSGLNSSYLKEIEDLIGQWRDAHLGLEEFLSKKMLSEFRYYRLKKNRDDLLDHVKFSALHFKKKVYQTSA